MTDILAYLVFPIALVLAGGWGLYLTRRSPEQLQEYDDALLKELDELRARIEAAEEALDRKSVPRVIVRPNASSRGGSYRRAAPRIIHQRVPAE